jgi:exportin-T
MTSIWGGPDATPTTSPSPLVPGFDTFAITRFSPLSWAIPATQGFRVHDPASRSLVFEMANLQQEILKKTGNIYLEALSTELKSMGVVDGEVKAYLEKLQGDRRHFQEWLTGFLGRDT